MSAFQLAQVNIARLIAPLNDPRIAGFVAQLESVNQLAEEAQGFVWRLKDEDGNATGLAFDNDPMIIVNMSVWESIEALKTFTYRTRHVEVFRQREQWFEKMELPHYCLWWIPAGHRPTVAEARERLQTYRANGSTPEAFWFSQWHAAPEAEAVSA